MEQNYLIINESINVVENVCVWDGNTNTWQPPSGYLMLVQATTPAMVWQEVIVDGKVTDYVLVEQIGKGNLEFTWNGVACITNQPKPQLPEAALNQPMTEGTQTL